MRFTSKLIVLILFNFSFFNNSFADNHNIYETLEIIKNDLKTLERAVYSGSIEINTSSNEGSNIGKALASDLKDREALIITFWKSYDDHENSHKSETFQPLFQKVIDVCDNGNEEIVYSMLWQGAAYTPEMAKLARSAKKENK